MSFERNLKKTQKVSHGKIVECSATQVIEVKVLYGNGTTEEPYKRFRQYWGLNGEFISEIEDRV